MRQFERRLQSNSMTGWPGPVADGFGSMFSNALKSRSVGNTQLSRRAAIAQMRKSVFEPCTPRLRHCLKNRAASSWSSVCSRRSGNARSLSRRPWYCSPERIPHSSSWRIDPIITTRYVMMRRSSSSAMASCRSGDRRRSASNQTDVSTSTFTPPGVASRNRTWGRSRSCQNH